MSENAVPVHPADVVIVFYRTEVLTSEEAKHFTKSNLAPSPKPEAVQSLYVRVLHLLFRFRPECHSMVPLVENIQHPECHEGATAILSVFARMRQFLPMCFVYDFSTNDLLTPKKHRTLTILSAIMNFLQFRKQRINVMSTKQAKFRTALDMQQNYAKGTQEAENKIEMLTTIPPEQQAEAAKLEAKVSELLAITRPLYSQTNAKNDTITEWKATIADKTQKLAQVKIDVNNRKEVITKLKSQIVESPEELESQMERMRQNIKDIKSSIGKTDEGLVELQNMVQKMNHTDGEMQQVYTLLRDLESSMNDSKQQHEEHKQLLSLYEKNQKELKNLCKEEEQLKRAQDMKLDREAKQNIRRQKEKEGKEQHVNNVLGQCNRTYQKREEKADKIQEVSRENQQLRAELQSLTDICSEETKKAQAMYDMLSSAMNDLDRRIEMKMLNIKEDAIKMLASFQ